jgi:hypothetical protein
LRADALRAAVGRAAAAEAAALLRRGRIHLLAPARSAFLAAAGHLIDRRPGATLGLFLADAALLISFFDMLGLSLLLARIA